MAALTIRCPCQKAVTRFIDRPIREQTLPGLIPRQSGNMVQYLYSQFGSHSQEEKNSLLE